MSVIIKQQDKVNLSYIYLLCFEKLNEIIKSYYFDFIDKIYRDINNPVSIVLRKKYGNNQNLSNKKRFKILVQMGCISQNESDLITELSKMRDRIAHNSGTIYFDDSFKVEEFRFDKLINLYKTVIAKLYKVTVEEQPEERTAQTEILDLYNVAVGGLQIVVNDLLLNTDYIDLFNSLQDEIII